MQTPLKTSEVACAGWGKKQGSKVKTWKTRYFVLHGSELVYYSSATPEGTGVDEKGRLTVVDVDYAPHLTNGLLIKGTKKNQILKMKTKHADESRMWFRKIKTATTVAQEEAKAQTSFRSTASASQLERYNSSPHGLLQHHNGSSRTLPGSDRSLLKSDSISRSNDTMNITNAVEDRQWRKDSELITKEGWLWIEEYKAKAWKPRYVTLAGDVLTYYADQRAQLLGSVTVLDVFINPSGAFTLDLQVSGERTLRLAAESQTDMKMWYQAIRHATHHSSASNENGFWEETPTNQSTNDDGDNNREDRGEKDRSTTTISAILPSYPSQRISREASMLRVDGWLEKRSQVSREWRRRYFTLADGMLEYRKTPNGPACAENYVVDVYFSPENQEWLEVAYDSDHSMVLRADTRDQLLKWMRALCDLVGKPHLNFVSAQPTKLINAGDDGIKRGWLLVQRAPGSSWKRRYFELDGNALRYYKQPGDSPQGSATVVHVEWVDSSVQSLIIQSQNDRTLTVSSEVPANLKAWYTALVEVTQNTGIHNSDDYDVSTSEYGSDDPAVIEPVITLSTTANLESRGWLLKKGQQFKTWKRRYFILERNQLDYYSDDTGEELLGSGVVIDASVGNLRPFCIDVRFRNGRLLHVVASSEEEFTKWLNTLQTASNLTTSLLSQPSHSQEQIFFEDFDHDNHESETANLIENTDNNDSASIEPIHSAKGSDNYSSWMARMENKPEWDRSISWDSALDEDHVNTKVAEEDIMHHNINTFSTSDQDILCHGWLRKEGGKIKHWQRRYFTLHGSKLSYYKSETGPLLRSFDITDVTEWPLEPFAMKIAAVDGRMLFIAAESQEEHDKWWTTLQIALRETGDTCASNEEQLGKHNDPLQTGYSGWLEKESQRLKTWKREYFTVQNSTLTYYNEEGGVAHGHGKVQYVTVDFTNPLTMYIHLDGRRVLRVSAASAKEMNAWYHALSGINDDVAFDETQPTMDRLVGDMEEDLAMAASGATSDFSTNTTTQLNASDHLANNTITNDSHLRARSVNDDEASALIVSPSSKNPSQRTFKGELNLGIDKEEHSANSNVYFGSDIEEDLALDCKMIQEDEERREHKRLAKLAQDEQNLILTGGCSGCCSVM